MEVLICGVCYGYVPNIECEMNAYMAKYKFRMWDEYLHGEVLNTNLEHGTRVQCITNTECYLISDPA